MDFLILPIKEGAVEDFRKIYRGLRANGMTEYARHLNEYVQVAHVDENNPYVEIKIPEHLKNSERPDK